MKHLIIIVALLLMASQAQATTITFSWLANPVEEAITGYRIYQDSGTIIVLDVAADVTTAVLPNVVGDHAYSITAYRLEDDNTVTESGHSNYVIYTHKKVIPSGPTLKAVVTK